MGLGMCLVILFALGLALFITYLAASLPSKRDGSGNAEGGGINPEPTTPKPDAPPIPRKRK